MRNFFLIRSASLMIISFCAPIMIIAQEEMEEDSMLTELIYEYSSKGYESLNYDTNLDTAEYYLKRALELQYSSTGYRIDERVAGNHVNLASVYRRIYNNTEALNNLNKAEEILSNDPMNIAFASIYHNKGNLYKVRNDLYRTKEYYEYALDFVIKIGYQNTTEFSHIFSNYISLLFELGEDALAEEQLSKVDINSLDIAPPIELRIELTNAYSYSKLDRYEAALSHFQKALEIINDNESYELTNLIISYYTSKIDFHIYYKEYEQALKECDKAFAFIESLDPSATKSKVNYNSLILYRSASILFILGNRERALTLINTGIANLYKFFEDLSSIDESASTNSENSSILPELYILKSRILLDLFKEKQILVDLKEAYTTYLAAIQKLNSLKLAMQDENSRVFATGQVLEVYNEAIYVGKLLYDMTGEEEYLERSYEFAESSKSFALYSEIKDVEAMEFSDLDPEIKLREDRLNGEIQAYEEMLYEERLSGEPDNLKITDYKDKLFHLKADYDNLMQEIEQNNRRYYELKYNPKFVTLAEVQKKLPYKEALIEYVLSDTMLITYVIDRKGIHVFSQQIGSEFHQECLEYYELMYRQNFSNGVHENYRRFVSLGRKFYQILIEPCLDYTDRRSFTIVPDGEITYIPFESLMTEDTDTEYINYMILPYMIRDYSIGYSYSSTLMFNDRLKTKSPERKVLAFAPEYTDPLNNATAELIRQVNADTEILVPLEGIIKEVQSIKETVPSTVFLNEQATETSFKKYASDYNVLHLAMHTIMRDDEPLYSYLAFTNADTSDTLDDNRLYAYEIYNLKLNAQMAVLSSCSSGFGAMKRGEGMMSLARGFIYAGCPSIIMTLWQVSDQSSSDLMTSFYRYLKKGKSKQEAMRLAKIDYLDVADDLTSNPYFWSGFVVVGDGNPIYNRTGFAYWMIIITLFLGLLVYFQYRRRRNI